MPTSSRFVLAFLGLTVAACTLERGGAGLTSTIDGGVSGAGGQTSGGSSQGGSSAGTSSFGGEQAVGGDAGAGGTAGGMGGASAGAAGLGATGGTGAAGAGGAVGNEANCLDGVDDDHDGQTDCADTADCGGYECVESAPAGWTGYFRLRDHATYDLAAAKLPCAGGLMPTRYFTEPTQSSCTACACEPLNGATCGDTPIFCATGNKSCSNPSDWTSSLSDGGCHKPGSGNSGSCYLGQAPVTNAGTCQPQGGEQSNPELFGAMVDICGTATPGGGGCSGRSCVPRASADYEGYVCISKMGEETCPSGWNIRRVASANGSDERTCSPCACGTNTTCSGGAYKVYDYNDCSGGDSTVSSTSCSDISGRMDIGTWSLRRSSYATPSGACTPSGGAPGGTVALTGTQTFCCRP